MRSQDLFDECRAGPRQPQDEDGIRVRDAPAPARLEEFPYAYLLRQPDVGLGGPGQVTNFRVLEGIATLIERPRFFISALVLQRLAQREAQVVSVYHRGGRRRFH